MPGLITLTGPLSGDSLNMIISPLGYGRQGNLGIASVYHLFIAITLPYFKHNPRQINLALLTC